MLPWILPLGLALAGPSSPPSAEADEPALRRFVGPRLPAEGEASLTVIGLGGAAGMEWVGDRSWSPLPYSGALLGGGLSVERLHADRLDRTRIELSGGSMSAEGGAAELSALRGRVENVTAFALAQTGAWTWMLGYGVSVDGELRGGLQDSFDAWALAELAGAARWTPPRAEGRWVLDASLKLPVAGAGLRPFTAATHHASSEGVEALNLSFVSWHKHATVGAAGRATRLLQNGNGLYVGADWRGRWSWAEPELARVSAGLELGLIWAFGGWR